MDVRLDSYVSDKTLVFTVTSDGYKYYTWNLWLFLQRCKVPWKLCILCLDKESYSFLQRIALIPCQLFVLPGKHIDHKTPALFGSANFKRMNRQKVKALQELSQRQEVETLVYLDSDIAVFRDPVPYMKERLAEVPLWFQCDEKTETFGCSNETACSNPCTGVIALRCSDETRPVFKQIFSIQEETWKKAITDQDYIQEQVKTAGAAVHYKTFARPLFPNGTFLSDNRYKEGDPFLVHFNYIMGVDKQRQMMRRDCWLVPVS